MSSVYLDNAATTPLRDEVIQRMLSTMKTVYGNASSTHSFGRAAKVVVEQARNTIASHLNVSASEIVFTSGGTESNNLILQSSIKDLGVQECITSRIEHHAVLHTLEQLKKDFNITITFVDLDNEGHVNYLHLESLLKKPKRKLVSLMHVNNEIGNLLDIDRVAQLCKKYNALFHSDCVQSIAHFNLNLKQTPIDFLVASAHKFHGPKGVGFAYIKKDSGLKPLILGGAQERGLRAGTESVHNIAGLEEAIKMAYNNLIEEQAYILNLKTYFIKTLKESISGVRFNGSYSDIERSTYTIVNFCLPSDLDAQTLLFKLDIKGIACSSGSACQSGSLQGSHVLKALLTEKELKKPALRFSFSIYNTKADIDYAIQTLRDIIN